MKESVIVSRLLGCNGKAKMKSYKRSPLWQRRHVYPRFRLTEREMDILLSGALERMVLSTNGLTIRTADDGDLIEYAV